MNSICSKKFDKKSNFFKQGVANDGISKSFHFRNFEFFEHTADIGLRAWGKTLGEAFENASAGMGKIISDSKVKPQKEFELEVEADDLEGLLVLWLSELLFVFETKYILFKDFDVEIDEKRFKARGKCRGEVIDSSKHEIKTEIKAVTYHLLKVEKNEDWMVQVLFDI